MTEFKRTVVDEFTDMIQDGAKDMISGAGDYEVKAFTVGYLNGFLNMLAKEIPEVREEIELRMRNSSLMRKEAA
jgi:hypothetical protein